MQRASSGSGCQLALGQAATAGVRRNRQRHAALPLRHAPPGGSTGQARRVLPSAPVLHRGAHRDGIESGGQVTLHSKALSGPLAVHNLHTAGRAAGGRGGSVGGDVTAGAEGAALAHRQPSVRPATCGCRRCSRAAAAQAPLPQPPQPPLAATTPLLHSASFNASLLPHTHALPAL